LISTEDICIFHSRELYKTLDTIARPIDRKLEFIVFLFQP
jgi:hypothetical protein